MGSSERGEVARDWLGQLCGRELDIAIPPLAIRPIQNGGSGGA